MKERFYLLFLYFTFWLIFFISARVIFLSYHILDTKVLTLELVYGIFKNGLKQDLSFTALLSVFPFLLITFSHYIKKSIIESFLFTYTSIAVFILTFIIVADLEVYNVWKFRIDKTPLIYLRSPREAFASVKSSPIIQLFISYVILLIIANYFIYRIIANRMSNWKHIEKFPFMAYSLLLTFSLIIPMRGGFGESKITSENLYFSDNFFANNATLNAPWHFFYTIFKGDDTKLNPYTFLPTIDIELALKKLFKSSNEPTVTISQKSNPNVLLILCESLSEKTIDYKFDNQDVTPFLNQLKNEAIYFPNVYAAGDHTEDGLIALLNGYPANATSSIIYEDNKIKNLKFLSKEFNNSNFLTEFYYGGNTSFLNLKNYLLTSDFQLIHDANTFSDSLKISDWGVYDHSIFNEFLKNHAGSQKSFFSTILTVSSHEPFEIPTKPKFAGEREDLAYLNAINYLDTSLSDFIYEAKKTKWWQNTLVIIIGDHGHRFPLGYERIEDFRIPLFITGGIVKQAAEVKTILSQNDIAQLIANELKFKIDFKWTKKQPLNKNELNWAYFSFNDGIGFVNSDGRLLYDNLGNKLISTSFKDSTQPLKLGRSLQQAIYEDYLTK